MIKNLLNTLILAAIFPVYIDAQSLDIYINSALKNSPLLYDYNNQILAGRLDSLLLIASFKPQINQVSQVMYPPTGSGWGYDEAITNGGNYSAVVNVSHSLFNKKQISGQLQMIALLSQTLKINEKITIIDLKKSITAQYLTAYTDFSQHQFNQSVLTQLNNELKTVKALVDKGVYVVTAYMNLLVSISVQKIATTQSFMQLKNDLAVLNYISGVSDQSEINLVKPEISVQNDFYSESSPLFEQFRIDSLKNRNSRQLIDLNYRPRLNIFADAGFNSVAPENVPRNMGTSFGVNFSFPIYDGKQRKLQYDKINTLLAFALLLNLIGCNNGSSAKTEETPEVSTPVTLTAIETTAISETISFNAVSIYQRKNIVKSTINGYIEKSLVNQGDIVRAGKPLYTIKTKEGDALSKFAAKDSSFTLSGKLTLVAPVTGIVVEATKQTNDYISDGEQLCIIAAQSSFVFLLNVPFEQNKYVTPGRSCSILLPDSTILKGTISGKLSMVDPVSQTQSYIVKTLSSAVLPENLSVLVVISKSSNENTQVIDKTCVLSDETMENFWVMKLINDTTAVKVDVLTGITAGNKIEILSPAFELNDRIINTGNYGLPDTAFVNIIQPGTR